MMPGKNAPDKDIGHQTSMRQNSPCDRRTAVMLKPLLQCCFLICVPICSNHWLCHNLLHTMRSSMNFVLQLENTSLPTVSMPRLYISEQKIPHRENATSVWRRVDIEQTQSLVASIGCIEARLQGAGRRHNAALGNKQAGPHSKV